MNLKCLFEPHQSACVTTSVDIGTFPWRSRAPGTTLVRVTTSCRPRPWWGHTSLGFSEALCSMISATARLGIYSLLRRRARNSRSVRRLPKVSMHSSSFKLQASPSRFRLLVDAASVSGAYPADEWCAVPASPHHVRQVLVAYLAMKPLQDRSQNAALLSVYGN
jgi:hypothetical protein